MTWTINITGHDDLTGDEKGALENAIVEEATSIVSTLKDAEGNRISTATVYTNTTGQINLLA